MGYARGKVGSVVLARVKGQQVLRAHNAKPHNRNTRKQIMHRSRLSTLYKFTKSCPPGLLEGAFPDQRPNENWQSCFVRHNIDRAIMQPKDWVEQETRAALGKFVMADGSLSRDLAEFDDALVGDYIGCGGILMPSPLVKPTIGNVSRGIIEKFGLKDGDLITFIVYLFGPQNIGRLPGWRYNEFPPYISAKTMRLDSSNTDLLDTLHLNVQAFQYAPPQMPLKSWVGVRDTLELGHAIAVIASRVEDGKVSTSRSVMQWPGANEAFWLHFDSEEWTLNVLRSWGMKLQAILDGEGL